jgi:hypothetical protein
MPQQTVKAHLPTGMSALGDLPQTVDGKVRLDLRGGQALVPEQLLNRLQIGPALQELRRVGVSHGMRR